MKFSLTVDSPREAGYATSMFQALQQALTADPPPVAQFSQTRFGDVSHTVLTGVSDINAQTAAADTSDTDQEDDTGTDAATDATTTAAGGTAPGKKRGRKSAEQKAAEALAKAAAEEHALKPGLALQGVGAQTLAKALEGMPLVYEGDGMQVRTAPDTPPDEIEAMRLRLQEQDEKIKAEEAAAAAELEAKAAAQALKDAAAAAKAAAVVVPPAAVVEPPVAAKPPADDDILASLFKKKEEPRVPQAQPAGSRFASMSAVELRAAFIAYINGEGGLLWARTVMEHFKLGTLEDLTPENTRAVLENPERFRSAA
jgi:hypothetical protein